MQGGKIRVYISLFKLGNKKLQHEEISLSVSIVFIH